MKRTLGIFMSVMAMVALAACAAFAQDASLAHEALPVALPAKQGANAWAIFLAAGLAIGIAAHGTGIGMGRAIDAALTGVSRNPSVAPRIMTMMILGLALIESLAIYSLVISILLLFVV